MIQPLWRAIWNYAQRAIKDCLAFDPAIPLLGLYPKEVIGKTTCTKIFIATLCGKLANEGMSFKWEMAEQVVFLFDLFGVQTQQWYGWIKGQTVFYNPLSIAPKWLYQVTTLPVMH